MTSFVWEGKEYLNKIYHNTSTGTLRPCKDESKNWDTTENLYIEGDNLEVLKLLQKSYFEKVKMIYIDPPYNTGKDFVYKDNFNDNLKNYLEITGQVGEEGERLSTNSDQSGRYHSNWLNMIYPRLKLARNLLKDDGVIFISIDDNEVAQLKILMDEIFGEENFVAELPTIMNLKGNNDEFGFAGTHEYTMVYSKDKIKTVINQFNINEDELEDWIEDEVGFYKQGANLKATGTNAPKDKRPNLYYPIYIDSNDTVYVTENDEPPKAFNGELTTLYPITNGQEMSWRWSKDKIKNEPNNIIVSRNGNIGIYKKQRPSLGDLPSKKPKTIFYKAEYSSGNGTSQIKNLFGEKYFANPKPIELIRDFISIGINSKNDIILDFFSGSATTAHAVMDLNTQDGGNRKFIMVQLPETTDENSEAYKAGYKNICEIGKERIRRAGEKIKEEFIQANANLKLGEEKKEFTTDIGFKVFKLDNPINPNQKEVTP